MLIIKWCHYIRAKKYGRGKKNANVQSLPIRKTNYIWIFVSLGGVANYRIFFFIKRIDGDILCDVILLHVALVAEKEHLINLLLGIFLQLILFSSEPSPELFQLLLQLVPLMFNILSLSLCSLLFLSHPMSLDLRHLPLLICLIQQPFPVCDDFPNNSQLALYSSKLGMELFIAVYSLGKKCQHGLRDL